MIGARRGWLVLATLVALAGVTHAEPVRSGWFLRNQLAGRYNPVGLFDELRVGYRVRLSSSRNWLLANQSASLAVNGSASPAFARVGLAADLQLLSMLNLSVIYEAGGYFGPLGLVQSYPSPQAATQVVSATDPLSARRAADQRPGYAATMQQLIAGAYVQLPLWRFTLRTNNRFVFQRVAIRAGDRVFYDQNWDILVPNGGWIYVNDVDLIVQLVPGLRVGARYNITHSFFTDGSGAPGDPRWSSSPEVTTQRLGPILSYLFVDRPGSVVSSSTLSLVLSWWIEPPHRAAGGALASSNPAIPYLGLALTFKCD